MLFCTRDRTQNVHPSFNRGDSGNTAFTHFEYYCCTVYTTYGMSSNSSVLTTNGKVVMAVRGGEGLSFVAHPNAAQTVRLSFVPAGRGPVGAGRPL